MRINTGHLRVFGCIAIGWLVAAGCARNNAAVSADKELFDSIKTGMSREEVERLAGKPVLEVGEEAYYGKPPKIEKLRSPLAPTPFSVTYSPNNIVRFKQFYNAKEISGPTNDNW